MIAFRLDGRIVGKVDEDNILQDAFMETVRRIQDYLNQPSVPFFVWLRQITNQVLIDTRRRYVEAQMRDVNREVSLEREGTPDTSSSDLIAQLADRLTSPSQCAVRAETIAGEAGRWRRRAKWPRCWRICSSSTTAWRFKTLATAKWCWSHRRRVGESASRRHPPATEPSWHRPNRST
jgi:hypothetical protein